MTIFGDHISTIMKKIEERRTMFEILVNDFNVTCRRHVDQMVALNQGTASSNCHDSDATPMALSHELHRRRPRVRPDT